MEAHRRAIESRRRKSSKTQRSSSEHGGHSTDTPNRL